MNDTLASQLLATLASLKALPPSRATSLAITKLEECAFWASCAASSVASPLDRLEDKPRTLGS